MANKSKKDTSKQQQGFVTLYLVLYNTVQTFGWSFLLYQTILHLLSSRQTSLYEEVSYTLIIFQNLAILEVVHACLELVSSKVQITVQQISSRVIVVCGALMISTASRESVGFPLLIFAWSITEIIRYSNYALNIVNLVPHFLVYLRYTTFYALYPIGVTGELLCLYATYKDVQENNVTVAMLSIFTYYYSYLLLAIMSLYLPLFPQMYLHMIKQRRKVLGSPVKGKSK